KPQRPQRLRHKLPLHSDFLDSWIKDRRTISTGDHQWRVLASQILFESRHDIRSSASIFQDPKLIRPQLILRIVFGADDRHPEISTDDAEPLRRLRRDIRIIKHIITSSQSKTVERPSTASNRLSGRRNSV